MDARRMFTREFKLEAVKLVSERGVRVAQAARDGIWASGRTYLAGGFARQPPTRGVLFLNAG